ncbi:MULTISPECIES: ABC transporter ATP-binding protein [Lactobacillus]|uniref:ABC transporter ATP-binding protein n=1 Tax=Lactobacillus TaxID=1578 RepID=UPI000CD88BC5|nr:MULTISPECIES: ABC transporter ATP-binding protein [Lactobacillus]RVU72064.1 ABC transporter ATP-binding protein [Lactobacillus xujianguonis]
MLKLEQVNFSYQNHALFEDLNLALPEHKITTLIGPNGSGKSTMFKLFTRAAKPSAGQVLLDEQDIWQLDAKKYAQKVAIVHQQNELYDEIKVIDLIKMGRLPYTSLLADEQKSDQELVDRLLEGLEITGFSQKYMDQLSGGQQQRVWLAVALAQQPEYLFLDEPTTYLDLHFQFQFLKILQKLNQEQGLTICMILHDLNQALQFSNQVVLLNHGKIQASGAPDQVITQDLISQNFDINCEVVKTKHGLFLRQY